MVKHEHLWTSLPVAGANEAPSTCPTLRFHTQRALLRLAERMHIVFGTIETLSVRLTPGEFQSFSMTNVSAESINIGVNGTYCNYLAIVCAVALYLPTIQAPVL